MIVGLISDIHGNIAALREVIADMEQAGAQRVICLGDVVGYGPFPGECLDLVKTCGAVIMGNHEEALLYEPENFNPRAKRAIDWTRDHLEKSGEDTQREARWQILRNLVPHAIDKPFLFTHGSPRQPTREYVMPRDVRNTAKMNEIFQLIRDNDCHTCFVGHTHVPGVFADDGTFQRPDELWGGTYFIDPETVSLINIGSVGQPRDNDTRSCYVLLERDGDGARVNFRRVEYDVEATARAIELNPYLDNYLAERLRHGR